MIYFTFFRLIWPCFLHGLIFFYFIYIFECPGNFYRFTNVSAFLIKFTVLSFFMFSFQIITFSSSNMEMNQYTYKYTRLYPYNYDDFQSNLMQSLGAELLYIKSLVKFLAKILEKNLWKSYVFKYAKMQDVDKKLLLQFSQNHSTIVITILVFC